MQARASAHLTLALICRDSPMRARLRRRASRRVSLLCAAPGETRSIWIRRGAERPGGFGFDGVLELLFMQCSTSETGALSRASTPRLHTRARVRRERYYRHCRRGQSCCDKGPLRCKGPACSLQRGGEVDEGLRGCAQVCLHETQRFQSVVWLDVTLFRLVRSDSQLPRLVVSSLRSGQGCNLGSHGEVVHCIITHPVTKKLTARPEMSIARLVICAQGLLSPPSTSVMKSSTTEVSMGMPACAVGARAAHAHSMAAAASRVFRMTAMLLSIDP